MNAYVLALALALFLVTPACAFDVEQLTCLPSGCGIASPEAVITGDGRRVLFGATCDLEPGRNPDGSAQLFLLDLTTRELLQVTPERLKWARRRGLHCNYGVTSDRIGERIVVVAECYRDGPASFRGQLLEFRTTGGRLSPLGPPVPCRMSAALSGDSRHLAVTSECNPGRVTPGNGLSFLRRVKLYFQDAPQKKFKRYRTRQTRRCRILDPALSHDGQVAVFSSECDLERGMNRFNNFQIFRLDRASGDARQVNPTDCVVSIMSGDRWVIVIDYPALSRDGQSVVFLPYSCGDEFGVFDAHVFRRREGADIEQLTFGFCGTEAHGDELRGLTVIDSPVGVSDDGRVIAFSATCDELPIFSDVTEHVFVYRDDAEPRLVRLFSQPSPLDGRMSGVSMDGIGSSLVFTARENPGGCPTGGADRQVYLVTDLADPTLRRSTCACPP